MGTETISVRDDLVIRRLILEPGEGTPWHTDPCQRFSVVVRGDALRIEFRDTGERVAVPVHAGNADWEEPEKRIHRAVNAGPTPYEEITTFLLQRPGMDPQPHTA
jgi:quercetin dioxygenase-like cupin family protein